HVDVPGAFLEAVLSTPQPGVRAASVTGSLTGGGWGGVTGDLDATVRARGADVEVADLRVELAGLPGPLGEAPVVVTGSGALTPALDLSGSVEAAGGPLARAAQAQGPAGAAGTWRLGGEPTELDLTWLGLEVGYALGPGAMTLAAPGDVS